MKIEKFQLRDNNSVRAVAFQLLRGRSHAQLRGNIECLTVEAYLSHLLYFVQLFD
jgi:hypothetical protein